MERPEIIGWEITTNENGIEMATLPRLKMNEILEYLKYAETELKKLRVADVSRCSTEPKLVKCDNCDEMVEMISTGEFCPCCFC